LLKPLFVVNPFVDELTFPDALTRMRRDHMKYLTLIRAIALLYQHQRPVKTEHGLSYIEATREDIATADRLMQELMRQSLDELPAQTRRLLGLIEAMVNGREGFQFSRREVRAHTGWGATQVRVHLDSSARNGISDRASRRARADVFIRVRCQPGGPKGRVSGVKAAPKRGHGGGFAAQ
jgi:alkylhydroperoxidase/carboxymuconolactone decarboxylase family protein YurZ